MNDDDTLEITKTYRIPPNCDCGRCNAEIPLQDSGKFYCIIFSEYTLSNDQTAQPLKKCREYSKKMRDKTNNKIKE